MRTASLLIVGLLCVSVVAHAGEVITNDTGEDATGLRVTFSEPVLITAFGDILTSVDPQMLSYEFEFSGGIVEPWGSHWINWAPSTAQIIDYQWITSGFSSSASVGARTQNPTLALPKTITTHFPVLREDVAEVDLPALDFSNTLLSQYAVDASLQVQPIDGFSPGSSVLLDSWYSSSVKRTPIDPIASEDSSDPFLRFVYPVDGDAGYVALQYREPVDLSGFEGLRIVASADHPVEIEVVVGICDDAIPSEDDEVCGESAALFSTQLSLKQETQVFILPFDQFEIHPYILQNNPTASLDPEFHGVFDMVFRPSDDTGVIDIHEVSAVAQVVAPEEPLLIVSEKEPPVINDYYFQHPAYVMQGVDDLDHIYALPLEGIPVLGTGYAAIDPDSEELTWTVESSTRFIGTGFQDETLYIWGAGSSFAGHGEVFLLVSDETGASSTISIPVNVFESNRTLLNDQGKKEHYLPWGPELDIRRILSTTAFLEAEGEADSELDRRINFSRYRVAEYVKGVTFNENWPEFGERWSWEAMKRLIDYHFLELRAAGVEWIFVRDPIFQLEKVSNELIRIYGYAEFGSDYGGWRRSFPKYALNYMVNRAHSLGMKAAIGNFISDINFGRADIIPDDWEEWWRSYRQLTLDEAELGHSVGLDLFVVGESLSGMIPGPELGARFAVVTESAREIYPGPVAYLDRLASHVDYATVEDWDRQFGNLWEHVDFLSDSPWRDGMFVEPDPSPSYIADQIRYYMNKLVAPLVEKYNKPLLFFESEMHSASDMITRLGEWVAGLPHNMTIPGRVDYEEQVRWYTAVFEAMKRFDWFYGPGWYGQNFGGPYVEQRKGSTFRNKPAEDVVRYYYGEGLLPDRAVSLDGHAEEWQVDDIIWKRDSQSGELPRLTISQVSTRYDGISLFLLVDLTGVLVNGRNDGLRLGITAQHGDQESHYVCRIFRDRFHWVGTVVSKSDLFEYVGFADVFGQEENYLDPPLFEIGLPLRLFENPDSVSIVIEVTTGGPRSLPWSESSHGEVVDSTSSPICVDLSDDGSNK